MLRGPPLLSGHVWHQRTSMKNLQHIVKGSILLGLVVFSSGCIVAEPRDGYYEREHHRYYREHAWHECREHGDEYYCR
jgi:hypothetical protein